MGRRPNGGIPAHHVWEQRELGLWQCFFCKGWFESSNKPDQDAVAKKEQETRNSLPFNAM
jgi:hypothetical protein